VHLQCDHVRVDPLDVLGRLLQPIVYPIAAVPNVEPEKKGGFRSQKYKKKIENDVKK
jgi:hypothetical protein